MKTLPRIAILTNYLPTALQASNALVLPSSAQLFARQKFTPQVVAAQTIHVYSRIIGEYKSMRND